MIRDLDESSRLDLVFYGVQLILVSSGIELTRLKSTRLALILSRVDIRGESTRSYIESSRLGLI